MTDSTRRHLLRGLGILTAAGLHPAIARALEIPARVRTGTIRDVEHIVILMQENRSFDHYFGALNGVRGFGDRFPIPVADTDTRKGKTVWAQPNALPGDPALIAPFALNTTQTFAHMRVEGTPHSVPDAQDAWDQGRMGDWPRAKHNHAMGYFTREDLPFQYALADAFTLCDAYHCAMHSGTNPNRLFLWTGTNDPLAQGNGPALNNDYDSLDADKDGHGGYNWTTYPERLQAAGIDWQVYQDMANNFTDNPLVGFLRFREADKAVSGSLTELAKRATRTRHLDKLREDVLADRLPQVSWIVAPDYGSEHPGPSSPAQGADYTAQVLEALTANPEVWSKTVLLINFDENDGFFDHVPPPAVPSYHPQDPTRLLGGSNIDTTGEYHMAGRLPQYRNRPYGLGPRVPMYVVSPWSKGGFVASEVFDHTSCIRFIEARFGVMEPNISAWRRAVCGDLTSCFDFRTPNDQSFFAQLPETSERAQRAAALPGQTTPPTPAGLVPPVQESGVRPRRALPYAGEASLALLDHRLRLTMVNNSQGDVAMVFHLYDRRALDLPPRRYTLKAGSTLSDDIWTETDHDLMLLGPGGFVRMWRGRNVAFSALFGPEGLEVRNLSKRPLHVSLTDLAYGGKGRVYELAVVETTILRPDLTASHGWYDFGLQTPDQCLRLAGHIDNRAGLSDPAMSGPARMDQIHASD